MGLLFKWTLFHYNLHQKYAALLWKNRGGRSGFKQNRKIAKRNWEQIPKYFPYVSLGPFIIMPNHLHGIIAIEKTQEALNLVSAKFGPQSGNLASTIRGYKSSVTIKVRKKYPLFCWQDRFFDRIVRDETELQNIIQYIYDNPIKG